MATGTTTPVANGTEPTTNNVGTSSIEEALETIRQGGFVVVMDNEDRENEGDLIAAAEFATEERVAFMLRHSTGIVCVPALPSRLEELQLPLMVENNTEAHKCKFAITVDLKEGNSTGVSAADRSRTIRALADAKISPTAFNRPGHIFPLLAQEGGVMVRAGHTEAATDLARLAGVKPVGYLCEIMGDDGRMLRRPQLQEFSQTHNLPLVTISDLICYRVRTETLVQRTQANVTKISTPFGEFSSMEYKSLVHEDQTYHALVLGDVSGQKSMPVFLVEDGFEAALQAQWAQRYVAKHGSGVLVYTHGSAQLLQISGELMARQSIFGMAMQIVRDLKVKSVRLLTATESSLDTNGFGIEIASSEHLATSA
ncbi:3,4-dihydroxy-2-butanone-4-phosphate synthase [Phytophthora nicotianae]|uniref:3,4-dihydroxy-2-butanone-4-phosphate synthase n=1 Tax=Phytophthora nicotianae TaxID=4792 RepID=W2L2Z8_PHYNI|nr:3,4-dihydroxy-2-butanone-4-phosphate synthase [Phytophthora nicotianae]